MSLDEMTEEDWLEIEKNIYLKLFKIIILFDRIVHQANEVADVFEETGSRIGLIAFEDQLDAFLSKLEAKNV